MVTICQDNDLSVTNDRKDNELPVTNHVKNEVVPIISIPVPSDPKSISIDLSKSQESVPVGSPVGKRRQQQK